MADATLEAIFGHICERPTDVGAYEDALAYLGYLRDERGTADVGAGWRLRHLIEGQFGAGWADVDDLERLGSAYRGSFVLDARDDLDCFLQAMEFDRAPEKRFWLPRRRLLMPACELLQWLGTDPDAVGALIAAPPRVGKSTISGFALAWNMGRHPADANLMVSYSDTICEHFHDQQLQLVTSDEYNFAEIFPDSRLHDKSQKYKTVTLGGQMAYPTLTCRSIEGTLTGSTEVSEHGWLYADDLVKDMKEAMSPTRLESKWNAYVNQCYDRRKDGARLLNVGTIWDVRDPQMRMMDKHGGQAGYRKLLMPALDPDTGESNFDYDMGKGFSRKYYLDMREITNEPEWRAKYCADPILRKGQLFAPDDLQYYLSLPAGEPESVVAVADTKDRGEDYCAVPCVARYGNRWFLVDALCDNGNPDALRVRVTNFLVKNNVQTCRFESNSAGGRFAIDVTKMLAERGALCAVTTHYTGSNKETRILAASPWILQSLVFPDPTLYSFGSDMQRFMDQLFGYTLDGKVPHDDAPDALSMLADMVTTRVRAKVRPVRRPF